MIITLKEKEGLIHIRNILNNLKTDKMTIQNARYHHNTNYYDAPSICTYGILSINDLHELGIKQTDEESLHILNDIESHVNGNNAISLSVTGLTDLYAYEDEYTPESPELVDFLISSEICAIRNATNYGNEFLSYQSIPVDKIKSIDIRLLEYCNLTKKDSYYTIKNLIDKYNALRTIALTIKKNNLNIPIREMSKEDNSLIDIDKLILTPQIVLKKTI